MSDTVDMYRAMREHRKGEMRVEKAERLAEAERLVGDQFDKLSPHHWRTTIGGYDLDYWPTTGKYRWLGRIKHATPEHMAKVFTRLRWYHQQSMQSKRQRLKRKLRIRRPHVGRRFFRRYMGKLRAQWRKETKQ